MGGFEDYGKEEGEEMKLCDFTISLSNPGGSSSSCGNVQFGVTIRPYMYECLERLNEYYELAVFTAAEQTYADKILDHIDPDRKFFKHRLYRQHCVEVHSE